MKAQPKARPEPWSNAEVRAVVDDYLENLMLTQAGVMVNKSATLRALLPKLNNRPKGSVEFKRGNISAILEELGRAYWKGYKPAHNYQQSLKRVVRVALGLPEYETPAREGAA